MKKSSFELALNKLLILYIIDNFNHRLKENDLSYFVLDIELFNYFYFKQYLKELESTGLVLFDNDKKYYLSEDGVKTLNIFYEQIPEENINFGREDGRLPPRITFKKFCLSRSHGKRWQPLRSFKN